MTDRFVVSTGRAGSTLFSRMLGENQQAAGDVGISRGCNPG
jgi:hypothetical protein